MVFLDSGWAVWVRHVVSHRLVKLHSAAPRTTSCGISGHPRHTHTASRGVQEEEDGDLRAEMQAVQQGVFSVTALGAQHVRESTEVK